MTSSKSVISIAASHIELGIKKYDGIRDNDLEKLIASANLQYIPYVFKDGRVLLVLPNGMGGLLYTSKEAVFEKLNLE